MCLMLNFVLLLSFGFSQENIISQEIQNIAVHSYFATKIQEVLENDYRKSINPSCLSQLSDYEKGLSNTEPWALQMLDATGKIPSGLLEGNIDMGSFDECLKVESNTKSQIIGKYCIGDAIVDISAILSQLRQNIRDTKVMGAIPSRDETAAPQIKQAVCAPDACSISDLSYLFQQVNISVIFSEENCQTKKSQPELDSGAIAYISFFAVIVMIMFISTLYDTYYYFVQQDAPYLVLTSFSILTNGKKLLSRSKNPDVISCLHGVRALSIVWVIVGHTYVMQLNFPHKNFAFILEWVQDVRNMFIIGATVSVDTFFLISGLTLTYSYLLFVRKGNRFNILLFYLHRYLRLTPALAAVMLFELTLLQYVGSGPYWPATVTSATSPCKTNWWKALLYIQNYGDIEICIPQTWYLSVDTQLYILSPIILLPLSIWPKITLIGTGILTTLSIISCFVTGWILELNGQIIGNVDPANPDKMLDYFKHYYIATYTRAAVWLIGVLYGFLLFKAKNSSSKLSINRAVIIVLWIISLTVICTCVYAGHDLMFQIKDINKFENSIHLALVRPSWGIAVGWIILACFMGYGGPVNWFLSLPGFEVLGKLSYAMYLLHSTVMLVYYGQVRAPLVFSNLDKFHAFWGNFGFTVIFSIILYLGVEYPIALIEQRLLGSRKGNAKRQLENLTDLDKNRSKIDCSKQP